MDEACMCGSNGVDARAYKEEVREDLLYMHASRAAGLESVTCMHVNNVF
jgi:hypothetical protein